MSAVRRSEVTVTRYEFQAPDYGRGTAIGDIHDAIQFAASHWKTIHSTQLEPTSDDWLRARGDEDGITFWFEHEETGR